MRNLLNAGTGKPRIAIAGATGRIGAALVNALLSDPVDIVALTRRTGAVLPAAVTAATVDFDRPATLESALKKADRLFIVHGTSPNQVENEIALIDAAVEAGVGHIVKLSALGPATRLNPFAWHMEIESHLAQAPVASTALRPSVFASVLLRPSAQIAAGAWTGAAGDGRINFIDTRDIAEVARLALLEEVNLDSQKAYHLTGARSWTMGQVADEFARLLGHPVAYLNRSPEEQYGALIAAGLPAFIADTLVGLDQLYRESALAETTTTFEELTGHQPRSLTEFLTDNITAFQAARAN